MIYNKIYNKIYNYTFYGFIFEIYSKIYIFIFKKLNKIYFLHKYETSVSDNGFYNTYIKEITLDNNKFKNFKRNPIYREILEHVFYTQGLQYLKIVEKDNSNLIKKIDYFLENDKIGNPLRYYYPQINKIASPTTLRYLKIASDIKNLFGNSFGGKICELGAGYGGQFILFDKIFKIQTYTIIDLPEVNDLIKKYLHFFNTRSKYYLSSINQSKNYKFDFFISNYAFSELPRKLQLICLQTIITNSKNGYMIMNSGKNNSVYKNHLSLQEIKVHIPNLQILDEKPLTHTGNYIIIWKN